MKECVVEGPVPVGALAEYREALVGQQKCKTEFRNEFGFFVFRENLLGEKPVPIGALAEYREALVGQQNVKTEF
ncbi:hypothetical protein [Salegentibacter sp.]|uniref:hypothetical protein n=1 Tax=Salegentibacter sp. TaxID=1903072 RepID=UPI0035665E8F